MTQHATKRLKERGGIPKRAAEKSLSEVLETMMPGTEMGGRLRRFVDHLGMRHHSKSYLGPNDLLYAVKGDAIITVMTVPQEHRSQARIQLAKWKASRAAEGEQP